MLLVDSFARIINFGESLDTPLKGHAYRESNQKQTLDIYGARILKQLTRPLAAAARLAVIIEDGKPAMIELPRVGYEMSPFMQRKIRSMKIGSEVVKCLILDKDVNDSRITMTGKIIRKYSIDEIPQLDNILNGDMSLVGPRPKSSEEVQYYTELDPAFIDAYGACLPGVTGLEQIYGRALLKPEERIDLIKEYAAEASLALDLDILRKTVEKVITTHGAY